MYEMMLNRKHNRKGFTLVEVIVVLVILAILAAIMIPSMVKWIDKANDKSILVEARSALLAAQTIASENYAKNVKDAFSDADIAAAKTLSGMTGTISDVTVVDGQVTALTYAKAGGKSVTYNGTSWSDPV